MKQRNMVPSNYLITRDMLDAGEHAMRQCDHVGGHTPRTICQAVFIAMLHAAPIHPNRSNLRHSFTQSNPEGITLSRPALARPLEAYRGLILLESWHWHAFDAKHRLHYFRHADRDSWIRLTEPDWRHPEFADRIARGWHAIETGLVYLAADRGWITKP